MAASKKSKVSAKSSKKPSKKGSSKSPAKAKKVKSKTPVKAKSKVKPKVQAKAKSKSRPKTSSPVKAKSLAPQKPSTPKMTPQKTKSPAVAFAKFFNPLDDRILVDVLPAETKTAGGLYIPDSGQEKPERGIVVAVGPGKRNKKAQLRPLDVKIGDEIIFAKYAGTAIEILGKEVFILREDEVLGIVN